MYASKLPSSVYIKVLKKQSLYTAVEGENPAVTCILACFFFLDSEHSEKINFNMIFFFSLSNAFMGSRIPPIFT